MLGNANISFVCRTQALEDDEMMRQYANLLMRQDTARAEALRAFQDRTALRAEVAGTEVGHCRFLLVFQTDVQSDLQSIITCSVSAAGNYKQLLCWILR